MLIDGYCYYLLTICAYGYIGCSYCYDKSFEKITLRVLFIKHHYNQYQLINASIFAGEPSLKTISTVVELSTELSTRSSNHRMCVV
jgi:sulfatase maturation enzyme AslB (radical SAM superfamily)